MFGSEKLHRYFSHTILPQSGNYMYMHFIQLLQISNVFQYALYSNLIKFHFGAIFL